MLTVPHLGTNLPSLPFAGLCSCEQQCRNHHHTNPAFRPWCSVCRRGVWPQGCGRRHLLRYTKLHHGQYVSPSLLPQCVFDLSFMIIRAGLFHILMNWGRAFQSLVIFRNTLPPGVADRPFSWHNILQKNLCITGFKVHLKPKMFFPKIKRLVSWSNVALKVSLNWLNPRIFMPRQSTSKCRHFGSRPSLTGHGSRAGCDVKSRTRWFCSRIFTFFCGEGCESSSKNRQLGTLQGGCSNSTKLTGGVTLYVIPILCRDDRLEAKKRRKRRVDFVKAKRAKRERESRLGVRRSVLCFSNQMISFNAWIFRKRKRFTEFVA